MQIFDMIVKGSVAEWFKAAVLKTVPFLWNLPSQVQNTLTFQSQAGIRKTRIARERAMNIRDVSAHHTAQPARDRKTTGNR